MPLLQVRDVPDHIYRLIAEQADKQRRSLPQQVIAVLARGLEVEIDAKTRRRKVLEMIQLGDRDRTGKLSDPAKLVRQDRRR